MVTSPLGTHTHPSTDKQVNKRLNTDGQDTVMCPVITCQSTGVCVCVCVCACVSVCVVCVFGCDILQTNGSGVGLFWP